MEAFERILAEHPFFEGLEAHHVELLVGCASNVRFDAGQFIFRGGEEANQFYLIRHGRVALEIAAPQRPHITVQTIGEGEILGWSRVPSPHPTTLSAFTRCVVPRSSSLRLARVQRPVVSRPCATFRTWRSLCPSSTPGRNTSRYSANRRPLLTTSASTLSSVAAPSTSINYSRSSAPFCMGAGRTRRHTACASSASSVGRCV